MARTKLTLEDSIFFYFSSAPLAEAQEQYKKVRGILAHRTRQVKPKRRQNKQIHPGSWADAGSELITT